MFFFIGGIVGVHSGTNNMNISYGVSDLALLNQIPRSREMCPFPVGFVSAYT